MKQDGDLEGFINAFKKMATDGGLTNFIKIHVDFFDAVHFKPKFLTWHCVYLKFFEIELQKRGAKYLPYWDHATGEFSSDLTQTRKSC